MPNVIDKPNPKTHDPAKVLGILVRKMGGFSSLGREFGVSGWAIQKWARKNSIPPERVPLVCDLAALHGVEVKPWQLRPDVYPISMFARRSN